MVLTAMEAVALYISEGERRGNRVVHHDCLPSTVDPWRANGPCFLCWLHLFRTIRDTRDCFLHKERRNSSPTRFRVLDKISCCHNGKNGGT